MVGKHPLTKSGDAVQPHFSRRGVLRAIGASAVGIGTLSGTATARGANIAISEQTARIDPPSGNDFPVPDAYIVELPRVKFEDDTGTIALPVKNSDGKPGVSANDTFWFQAKTDEDDNPLPAFVVGLHSPKVGNGRPDSLSSLIGVRPFTPGKYNNVKVPVWGQPAGWQSDNKGKVGGVSATNFPNGETIEVTATLWYGPDRFPPDVRRDKAPVKTPKRETIGPVSRKSGKLISNSAEVTFPSQS